VNIDLQRRANMHAALGDPHRLAIVDDLTRSDRSPRELSERLGIASNLLAHHLDVLDEAGLITRTMSAGDRRRRYVRLSDDPAVRRLTRSTRPTRPVLFLCSHNSARSQLAAALWRARTGLVADSAGTHPAPQVHRRAVSVGRRHGLDLTTAVPRSINHVPARTQVITVCDNAHEELSPARDWWHWSIPDPVEIDTDAAFEAVVDELNTRIDRLTDDQQGATR
jgi:protein-tyrosine-phosphatase